MEMRIKVFLSTMWDLYFFWRFDCKFKMRQEKFREELCNDLRFLFNDGEKIPDLQDAIKELYNIFHPIEKYYQCDEKMQFVEKYSKMTL